MMRVVFINNSKHPTEKINEQVKMMNSMVIKTAMSQISSGVSQYIDYIRYLDTQPVPIDIPVNTSTYGNKIPVTDTISV
jgi:hypothetical protein